MANNKKSNWVRKIRSINDPLQQEIIKYLKNDQLMREYQERIDMQEEELQQKSEEIYQLKRVVELIDDERHFVRQLNHEAGLRAVAQNRKILNLRNRLQKIHRHVARQLNFDYDTEETVMDTDNE